MGDAIVSLAREKKQVDLFIPLQDLVDTGRKFDDFSGPVTTERICRVLEGVPETVMTLRVRAYLQMKSNEMRRSRHTRHAL